MPVRIHFQNGQPVSCQEGGWQGMYQKEDGSFQTMYFRGQEILCDERPLYAMLKHRATEKFMKIPLFPASDTDQYDMWLPDEQTFVTVTLRHFGAR